MKLSYKNTKIACYAGYTVQAIINNFLPIFFVLFRKEYGLSYEALGRIVFVNFAVQIFADISTPFLVKKIGYKYATVICHFLAAFGLFSFCFTDKIISDSYIRILTSVIIYAFGSGIIEVAVSPIMEYLPTENKAGNMSLLHSFYCWGQAFTIIVTTFALKLFGNANWRYIPVLWAVIPFLNMIYFCLVPVVEPKPEEKGEKQKTDKLKLFLILVLMVCSGASEIAISQWASYFAQKGLNISKVSGDLLGPCAFAVLMGIGRVLYAAFSDRIPFLTLSAFSATLCALCYFTIGVCNNPIISIAACAVCGISVSVFWPGTLSLAVKIFDKSNPALFGMIALFGDIGCSVGPWMLGAVADNYNNLKSGYIACLVFPILIVLISVFLKKEKVEKF